MSLRRWGTLVMGLVTTMVTLLPGEPAAAAQARDLSRLVGVNSHLVWRGDAEAQLDRIAGGGVSQVRESFMWNELEATRGAFSWSKTDRLMTAASRSGVDVLAVLTHSPSWATSVAGNVDAPPRDPADYATAAGAVAGRYGAGGTFWAQHPELTPRPLAGLELWNEPWGYWDWAPEPDPAAYAAMAELAATRVRLAAPSLRVLIPGDLLQVRRDGQVVGWVDKILQAKPSLIGLTSAWSVHPYPYPKATSPLVVRTDPRWDFGRVELVRDAVRAAGSAAPLWLTEIGWHTGSSTSGVSEATQATFVRDAITRTSNEWSSFVERIFVYAWGWDSADPADSEGRYALLRADGSAKPAWQAVVDLLATRPEPTPSPTPVVAHAAPTGGSGEVNTASSAAPAPATTTRSGYWMATAAGEVHAFGDAAWFGDAPPGAHPVVDVEPTPAGDGYWLVDRSGAVRPFGSAAFLGDASGLVGDETATSLSATPSGAGYWIFTTTGRVLAFGDAPFVGDLDGMRLNAPVLDSIPSPSGQGYYLVAADGGIFTFGDAAFAGSMGDLRLNSPVQSLVPDPDGAGYWLVGADGGIFAFDAPFYGSMGDTRLNRPITGMVGGGNGYLMVGEDGGIFTFAAAAFLGSLGDRPPASAVVSVAMLGR